MQLNKKAKLYRLKNEVSQSEVADQLCKSQEWVSKLENNSVKCSKELLVIFKNAVDAAKKLKFQNN